jgi:predicted metalloprotease with PDZ domain
MQVATGLDTVAGKRFTFSASNFDVLYDSPLLAGNLEKLPAFTVQGMPSCHHFLVYYAITPVLVYTCSILPLLFV